jgi:hypothetical protein
MIYLNVNSDYVVLVKIATCSHATFEKSVVVTRDFGFVPKRSHQKCVDTFTGRTHE